MTTETKTLTTAGTVRAIFVGSVGNLVEWFDFYSYAAFSLYFAKSFFPGTDPVAQQLNTSILFALTFFVRPIGAWLFGYLADSYGRRISLMLSVLTMCGGSLIIAVSPTYESIGFGAPVLLSIARIIQGISLGGEYGASAAYISEIAEPSRRGFFTSFLYVTLLGGQVLALLVLVVLERFVLTQAQLYAWGWRIPFYIGAGLALFSLVMRRELHESESFTKAKKANTARPPFLGFLQYPREVLLVIGLTMGGTAAFYTFTTYMQKFLKLSTGLNNEDASLVSLGALIFALFLQPLYGHISDKVGRRGVLMYFGAGGTLFTIPLLYAIAGAKGQPLLAFAFICLAWVFVSGYTSINAVVKAELFPTKVRAVGVAVPYALTVSLFGGSQEAIALKLKQLGYETSFYYFLTACIFVSALVYFFMRDTQKHSAIETP